MDHLGWTSSPVIVNTSSLWSTQQNEIQESYMLPAASSGSAYGCRNDPSEIFHPTREIQRTLPSSDRSKEEVHDDHFAPASDSINAASSSLSVADTAIARLGTVNKWGETVSPEVGYSSLINRPTCLMNLTGGLMANSCMFSQAQALSGVSTSGSLESLDCLFSASNSNTDTSGEEDEISVLFSECRNIWNFGSSNNAASPRESENNSSQGNGNIPCPANDCADETMPFESRPKMAKKSNGREKSNLDFSGSYLDLQRGSSLIFESKQKAKRPKFEKRPHSSSNINFQQPSLLLAASEEEPDSEAIAQMKDMIYRAAAFRPVNLGMEVVEKPKRKNVKISTDPQTVAARQRRERISERIRVLQRLVPGGSKMDTATMLDEAANYLKFLKSQVRALESRGHNKLNASNNFPAASTNLPFSPVPFNHSFPMQTLFPAQNSNQVHHTSG